MNINEYLENRVMDQINWYDKKSSLAQRYYKIYQIIEIISATCIPILAAYAKKSDWILLIIAILGGIITVVESITRLYKFHENWIEYRTTSELLKYHRYLFLTESAPYNNSDETLENFFVRNIESIISSENNTWKALNTNVNQEGEDS